MVAVNPKARKNGPAGPFSLPYHGLLWPAVDPRVVVSERGCRLETQKAAFRPRVFRWPVSECFLRAQAQERGLLAKRSARPVQSFELTPSSQAIWI